MAAALLCARPAVARATKLNPRLQIDRSRGSSSHSVQAAGAPGRSFRVLVRVSPGVTLAEMRAAYSQADFGSQAGPIVTASVPDSVLTAFETDPRVVSVQAARTFRPTMDVARSNQTSGGLYLGTTLNGASTDLANADGSGVVVGIVDSGIDYRHADFVFGGASRIKWLWDQTDSGGPAQSLVSCGSHCGTEWTNAQITSSLASGSPVRERDTDGHGTHVAGIAAGNGAAGNGTLPPGTFVGMAPKADLVIVKTDFTDAGILDGMSYIVARAAGLGERAVINLSLGNQFDPHDGTSNFDVGVGAIAASTPVVVAMGNDGASSPHAQMTSLAFNQSVSFSIGVSAGYSTDVQAQFWGASSDSFTATVSLPGYSCAGMTQVAGTQTSTSTPYACSSNYVYIFNASSGTGSTSAADREMYIDVYDPGGISLTNGVTVTVTCTSASGCGRLDGFVFPGAEATAFLTGAGYSVPATLTMAAPATADDVFAVGSYASKVSWVDSAGTTVHYTNGQTAGTISDFSGTGPTRDGRQKPDVAAPGEGIGSSLSADAPICSTCEFDTLTVLQDGVHGILQGTSMAAPVVTGILATRLQGFPSRTVAQLRAIVQGAARSDAAVTGAGSIPNTVFGYGKVTASPQPQGAPTGVTATALGTSSITWSWDSALLSADAFNVYIATNSSQLLAGVTQPPFIQTGLLSNATYGILLRGEGGGVDGAAAFITTATYAAAPASSPSATGFVSTAAVTYALCGAPPGGSSCTGYAVQASTASDFSGTVFSSSTTNRLLTTLVVSGLSANTAYSVRLGALNPLGAVTWGASAASFNTGTDLLPPISPVFDQISTGSIRFSWSQGFNPSGLTYVAQASTAADYSGTLYSHSGTAFVASFGGLSADTSYYFRVQGVGGPFLTAGPSPTLALAPAVSTTPFIAVTVSGLTAAWANPGNPSDTLYKTELSLNASFSPVAQTSYTRTTAASFSGLTSNTAYYARAQAVSRAGTASALTTVGSTSTLVSAPTSPVLSAVGTGGFTLSFTQTNPGGTVYAVRVATDPGYAVLAASAATTAASASFTGLESDQIYYASVAGLNQVGTPSAFVGASTATTVATPLSAAVSVTTRTATGFGFAWSPGTLAAGTVYDAQVSSSPSFAAVISASSTANAYAAFSGLQPNTTYYARVRALSSYPPNPDGAFLSAASGATLADPPTAAGTPFAMVAYTSMTVAWTALPLSPSSRTAEGYRVELSSAASFPTVSVSATVGASASSATLTGLQVATTYYARVASLSWEGFPDYLWVAGATRTFTPALSSGTMTSSGVTLIVAPLSALTQIRMDVTPGTFPNGTVLSAVTSVGPDLTGARSNEAAGLVAFGDPRAFDLDAGGLQPSAPIRLTISYDPARIPSGQSEDRLHLWRYDPASEQWTLIPSQADPATHTLIASIQHFSFFAPFFVTAGTDFSAVSIFPQPWEIGDSASRYWAGQLSMTGLPAGARVRLFTLTGEEVVGGHASGGGIFTWDGNTRFGRRAASGTYYAVIESNGAKLVRRVVILR